MTTPFPQPDFHAAWAALSPDMQARIGGLAIANSFYLLAGSILRGDRRGQGVVYLDRDGREKALEASEAALNTLDEEINAALPDLFGEYPSPEHPNGTDPAWATPMVFSARKGAP